VVEEYFSSMACFPRELPRTCPRESLSQTSRQPTRANISINRYACAFQRDQRVRGLTVRVEGVECQSFLSPVLLRLADVYTRVIVLRLRKLLPQCPDNGQ